MELTKEQLERALEAQAATIKHDITGIIGTEVGRLERKIEASRRDVIHRLERVESSLAHKIASGLDSIDVRPRIDKLETKMATVESALNINL